MRTTLVMVIGILAILVMVSTSAMAITIPGANRNAPQLIPVYSPAGDLLYYTLDLSQGVQVSPTRIQSIATSKTGKPLWYLQTLQQGSDKLPTIKPNDPATGFNTPYPPGWDQSLTKFTYLGYIEYCQRYGYPPVGNFVSDWSQLGG